MKRIVIFMTVTACIFNFVLLTAALHAGTSVEEFIPRKPLPKSQVQVFVEGSPLGMVSQSNQYRLIVKFRDDLKVRTIQWRLVPKVATYMGNISQITQRFGMTFSRLIKLSEQKLQHMERRASKNSGIAQSDLAGIMVVHMRDTSPVTLEAAGQALQALEEVEFAYIQTLNVPPPGDIAPTTPLHVDRQTYRGPDPGMNVDYAFSLGYTGAGINLLDCEYGWNATHEDLNDINLNLEPGQTIHPSVATLGYDSHGTAVLGETSGVVNNYGVSGMSPDSMVYTFPEWTVEEGYRRTTAIANAIANSSPGDIVLLEMQDYGYNGAYVMAEFNPAVWVVVKNGTDAGVIVVGAAGNGNADLDGINYADYMARGDSGAIIVGAGSDAIDHSKLTFSTYGSRVNLQGWGTGVFTLGYGSFAAYGGDKNQRYTSTFSGTSSASPFVASAAAIVQQAALDRMGYILTPLQLRDLLIQTGIPQLGGGHIGPFPDLKAAIDSLTSPVLPDIKANSSDGPVTINEIDTLILTVELNTFGATTDSDWWLTAETPMGPYSYRYNSQSWIPGSSVTYQGSLSDLAPYQVLNMTNLPLGTYNIMFGVDSDRNGILDIDLLQSDTVDVIVQIQ